MTLMTPVPLLFLLLSSDRLVYFHERIVAQTESPVVPIRRQVSNDFAAVLSVQTDRELMECDKILLLTASWPLPPTLRFCHLWHEPAVYDWLDPANLNQKPLNVVQRFFSCNKTARQPST
jgi:hypothetical protein